MSPTNAAFHVIRDKIRPARGASKTPQFERFLIWQWSHRQSNFAIPKARNQLSLDAVSFVLALRVLVNAVVLCLTPQVCQNFVLELQSIQVSTALIS